MPCGCEVGKEVGINIVAIHSHMESETPKILFLHYWGRGPALEIARVLRAALNENTN